MISCLVQVLPTGRGPCPRASPRLSAVPPTQSSPAVLLTLSLLQLCLKCYLLKEAFSDYCVQILFYSAIRALALLILHSSVQSLSHVRLFATPWTTARQASLSITTSQSLLKLISVESVRPSNHLILCRPLLLPPSVFPSIRVFFKEFALPIRWPKDWGFSFSISPSSEYSALISFKMGWLDLLAVQGTLKSLLQHHSSEASVVWRSAFFYCPALTSVHDCWKNHSFDC